MDEPAAPVPSDPVRAPSPAPPAKPTADLAFLVAAATLLVASLVLVRNLLPAKQDLATTLRREEALKRDLEALRAERELLVQKEKGLRDDPAYIDRTLRGQTGMTKPGEFIVR